MMLKRWSLMCVLCAALLQSALPARAAEERLKFDVYARGLGARLLDEKLKTAPESREMLKNFQIVPRYGVSYVDLNDDKSDEVLAFFNDEYFGLYDGDNINSYRFSIYRLEKGDLTEIGRFFGNRIHISDQRVQGYYTFIAYDEHGKPTTHRWTGQKYD